MKIGILTFYSVCNYGANLQALSTYEYIRNSGNEPIFINWYPKEIEDYYIKITPKEQYNCTGLFIQKYLKETERCYNSKDIASVIEAHGIEAIIIGSDAILQHHPWFTRIVFPTRHVFTIQNTGPDKLCPNPFWGDFYQYLKKPIPMAIISASSQNSPYKTFSHKEKKMMDKLLSNFTYISTRDDWTANMVSAITFGRITPSITPDPVFAFNYNVKYIPSETEIRKKFNLSKPYYLVSFHHSGVVSQNWLSEFASLANEKDIETIAFPFPPGIEFKHPFYKQIDIPLSPLDWYALIKYSSGFIGHNMHPIVIALSNAVPCFSFDHYGIVKLRRFVNEKSSKIYHIMNHFGVLDNRISCAGKGFNVPSPKQVIDKLDSFDSDNVKVIAENYHECYRVMMNKIFQSFQKSL